MDRDTDAISHSIKANNNRLDFDSICRCCMTNKVALKPIFNSVGSIPQAIFLFTAVKLNKDDGFPGNICTDCLDQLNNCIRFKRKVEAIDLILQKYFTDLTEKHVVENKGNRLECRSEVEDLKTMTIEEPTNETFENRRASADYTCTVCKRSYATRSTYNRHIKVHASKGSTLRCNVCGKKFTDEAIFEAHQICHDQGKANSTTSTEQLHSCPICKDKFRVEQDLFIHSCLHEDVNKFNCKACGKDFENLAKLKRHIPRHFIEKPFKCKKCSMGFAEMASLTRHYMKHVAKKQILLHKCSVCGKDFPNQYTLNVHTRYHTGERPWACTKCDKQFTDYRLLNSHKKLHEHHKPYECEKCRNRFRHQSTLTAHMQTHTADRPYRCDKCRKSYKQLWTLRMHKRTHVERKHFACNECTQVFETHTLLKHHLQWHRDQITSENQEPNMEIPPEFFHCKDCSAQFPSRLDLIVHEKLTHALSHECDTCFGKWKTLEELVQHKCNEALGVSDEPTPDEMILLPNGEIQDCNTVVNTLLASVSIPPTGTDQKASTDK